MVLARNRRLDSELERKKILNCEKFTLTSQTASAFVRTLKCQASLIEDLLAEGCDFIMTSRFQSDLMERRFGQYRQMSGVKFLVGLREAISTENIIKLKTLLKDDNDIGKLMDSNVEHDENIEALLHHADLSCSSEEMVSLSEDSREVGIYIAGYIAKKLKKRFGDCSSGLLINGSEAGNPDFSYVQVLSRGSLKIPSTNLVNYVCTAFTILEFVNDLLTKSGLTVCKAAEHVFFIVSSHSRHLLVPHLKQLHEK